MNLFNKTIQKLHRITGLTIALFFVMWFVSGIILLYHKYPRVSSQDLYAHSEKLIADELPAITELPGMSDSIKAEGLSVGRSRGETVWTLNGVGKKTDNPMKANPNGGNKFILAGDTLIQQKQITKRQLDSIACEWAQSVAIAKVDTLTKRGQWILYERYEKSLPILKYSFHNPQYTEVYISQNQGDVLQMSTRSERIWSWFGAIPHKLYIPALRTDVERWKTVLLTGGLLCLAAALSGMYIGIYYLVVNKRKRHSFSSPFKKRVWRCHHISGLIFGIFLTAWGVSGSLAMQRLPKWIVDYEGDYFVSSTRLWGRHSLPLRDYKLDYRDLAAKYPDIKSISWEHFGDIPAYLIISGDREIYIDASEAGMVKPLKLTKDAVEKAIVRYYGADVECEISLQDDYDEYYLSRRGDLPLPVWRVDIDNKDGARMYISPTDGYVKYLNNNRKVKKWLFAATHYLDIKYLVLHRDLRYACLWILSIGCVFVIASGVAIYVSKEKSKLRKK